MQRTKIFLYYFIIFKNCLELWCHTWNKIYDVMKKKKKEKVNILWTDYFSCHSQPSCAICNSENMNVLTIENIGTIGAKFKTMVTMNLCLNTHVQYRMFTKDNHYISLELNSHRFSITFTSNCNYRTKYRQLSSVYLFSSSICAWLHSISYICILYLIIHWQSFSINHLRSGN